MKRRVHSISAAIVFSILILALFSLAVGLLYIAFLESIFAGISFVMLYVWAVSLIVYTITGEDDST